MAPSSASLSLPSSYVKLPYEHIRLSHNPASSPTPTSIITINLHRPAARNAFTDLMTKELVAAFTQLSSDPRVRCIILTGSQAGGAFCAGADLQAGFSSDDDTLETHRDGGAQVALAINNCTKPVIAAINGHAVGVGITMTLPCAMRVVSRKAKIGFVFARRGIVMEAASGYFLPRLIGYSRAMQVVTRGSVYSAEDRVWEGLWTDVVDPDRVLDRALELGREVAENCSLVSWNLNRDLMWRGPGSAEEAALLNSRVIWEVIKGKDKEEGVKAFLEKREVDFKGDVEEEKRRMRSWPWWEEVNTGVPKPGLWENVKSKL